MIVDVRPTTRLRGTHPVDLAACLGPIVDSLREDDVDLSRLRVVCDWVQYRNNFREVVDLRSISSPTGVRNGGRVNGTSHADIELAVDLRRCQGAGGGQHDGDEALRASTRDLLAGLGRPERLGRLYLEPWTRATQSRIWDFNALYWRFLGDWEEATGRRYEQALPGGESDARNVAAVRELLHEMFAVWDDLVARNALPEELYVVELGVGNGHQAKTWLDEFVRMDRERGRDYYRRLHYLMCDYSEHVLGIARTAVTDHAAHVSSFALDATSPATALKFLRYKVFLVYVSNVYDNLPSEEVAHLGGHTYRVEVRAYLPQAAAERLAALVGVGPAALPEIVAKLLRLGPTLLAEALPGHVADPVAATAFWRATWDALKLEERYVPLPGLDLYEVAPGVSGEVLRPMLESDGDIRMHVGNGAVASFADTLPLLHPYGRLQCHDLFVTSAHDYRTGFRGPGKYDGSVVNWVNGPLLQHIGGRRGFDVTYAPFAHRTGTNIVTMTAQVRD